ncbi:MAG: site-specific integrase [Candidatus Bathyarchaeia archaeon]
MPYKYTRSRHLSLEELNEILEKTPQEWLKALTILLYYSGMRISEALNLKREDITLTPDEIIIKVETLKRRRSIGPYMPERIIPLPRNLPFINILARYLENASNGKLWNYSRKTVWLYMKRIKKDISPHLFRHDRLYMLSMNPEITPFDLRDWAGWSDLRPAENYIQISGQRTRRISKILNVIEQRKIWHEEKEKLDSEGN